MDEHLENSLGKRRHDIRAKADEDPSFAGAMLEGPANAVYQQTAPLPQKLNLRVSDDREGHLDIATPLKSNRPHDPGENQRRETAAAFDD